MLNEPYVWTACALALLLVEGALAQSLVAVFFGFGALLAALAAATHLLPAVWQQCLLFAAASTLSLVLARKPLLRYASRKAQRRPLNADVGATAVVVTAMAPGGAGEVTLHGVPWSAINVGPQALALGARVVVRRLQGLTAEVVAKDEPAEIGRLDAKR